MGKKHILLVDDEVNYSNMLKFEMEANGYTVELAINGVEALEKVAKTLPDLIVLDVNMPKMGGIEFYENLSKKGIRSKVPILVLTARSNVEELFRELDANGFMTKPFSIELFLKEIDTIIQNFGAENTVKPPKAVSKKVLIIEEDMATLDKIALAFVHAGWTVRGARGITEVIEMADVADIILVNLNLSGFSGDQVILKLKNMPSFQNSDFILFAEQDSAVHGVVMEKYQNKGARRFINTKEPYFLLETVNDLIAKTAQERNEQVRKGTL